MFQDINDSVLGVMANIDVDVPNQWYTVFGDQLEQISMNIHDCDLLYADILQARQLKISINKLRNVVTKIDHQNDTNKSTHENAGDR